MTGAGFRVSFLKVWEEPDSIFPCLKSGNPGKMQIHGRRTITLPLNYSFRRKFEVISQVVGN